MAEQNNYRIKEFLKNLGNITLDTADRENIKADFKMFLLILQSIVNEKDKLIKSYNDEEVRELAEGFLKEMDKAGFHIKDSRKQDFIFKARERKGALLIAASVIGLSGGALLNSVYLPQLFDVITKGGPDQILKTFIKVTEITGYSVLKVRKTSDIAFREQKKPIEDLNPAIKRFIDKANGLTESTDKLVNYMRERSSITNPFLLLASEVITGVGHGADGFILDTPGEAEIAVARFLAVPAALALSGIAYNKYFSHDPNFVAKYPHEKLAVWFGKKISNWGPIKNHPEAGQLGLTLGVIIVLIGPPLTLLSQGLIETASGSPETGARKSYAGIALATNYAAYAFSIWLGRNNKTYMSSREIEKFQDLMFELTKEVFESKLNNLDKAQKIIWKTDLPLKQYHEEIGEGYSKEVMDLVTSGLSTKERIKSAEQKALKKLELDIENISRIIASVDYADRTLAGVENYISQKIKTIDHPLSKKIGTELERRFIKVLDLETGDDLRRGEHIQAQVASLGAIAAAVDRRRNVYITFESEEKIPASSSFTISQFFKFKNEHSKKSWSNRIKNGFNINNSAMDFSPCEENNTFVIKTNEKDLEIISALHDQVKRYPTKEIKTEDGSRRVPDVPPDIVVEVLRDEFSGKRRHRNIEI